MRQKTPSLPKKAALFVAGAMLLWGAAAVFVLRCAALDVLLFLLYQAAFVAAPGIALFKLLGLALTPLEGLVLSYALGLGLNIAVYFLFAPFGLAQLIPYALAVLAALAVVVLIKTRKRRFSRAADTGELRIALVACCVAAALSFVLLSATHLDPMLSGTRFYENDTLNGVGLLSSAARGFPLEFLQMSGTPYYYHPFFYAYGACMKLTLGIPAFELATKYMLITISPWLIAAAVALGRRLIRRNWLLIAAFAAVFLLPVTGNMVYYYYIDLLGFPLSLGFSLVALGQFLTAQQRPAKGINRHHILTAVFVLLALGAKGPIAVTLLFGLCFVLLVEFIKKPNWNSILKGLLLAVPFFVVYFLLYRDGAGDSMVLSIGRMALHTRFGEWMYTFNPPSWLFYPIAMLMLPITEFPVLTAVLVLALISLLSKKPEAPAPLPLFQFLAGALAFGFCMISLVSQAGSSEVYFLICLYPVGYLGGAALFERLFDRGEAKPGLPLRLLAGALGLAAVIGGAFAAIPHYAADMREAIQFSRFNNENLGDDDLLYRKITPLEYEAYIWIRDNTDPDAVFLTSRHNDYNKYFYGTAFAERAFYLEGWGYVTMEDTNQYTQEHWRRQRDIDIFYGERQDVHLLILNRDEGVDYAIVFEYDSPGYAVSPEFGELVYSNAEVRVYKAFEYSS